ncbi:MAG: hypothetical protein JSV17_09925 [Candidatus Aminicenantes bacterium]|nr:MAG: hypothetical protein JSV17_09925 [Candidatus Aminicenantes bacterium]
MCKFIRLFYFMIPIHGFRAFLIQKHFSGCSKCQKEWGLDQSAQGSFTKPDWIAQERSLWSQIRERIYVVKPEEIRSGRRQKTFLFPRWRWALAGLALLILAGISFVLDKSWIHKSTKEDVSLTLKNFQVNIKHAKIHGKKAKPFIYQTQENLFIWFDEINQEED